MVEEIAAEETQRCSAEALRVPLRVLADDAERGAEKSSFPDGHRNQYGLLRFMAI
jgi:hypothetical protein